MKISIIHPTRGRKQQALLTMRKWMISAGHPKNIQYILSVDNSDIDQYSDTYIFSWSAQTDGLSAKVLKSDNKSAIEAINKAAEIAIGDILIVVSDDTDCPMNWDALLLNELKGKSDFCAKVDDGLQPALVTMPIMDREYYKRYGYVYQPDYKHMFCDQELTAVAIMTGKYIKLPLTFNHLHYSTGRTPKDALNLRNDSTWHQGETLFHERLKTNFGIKNPVIPYSEIKWR